MPKSLTIIDSLHTPPSIKFSLALKALAKMPFAVDSREDEPAFDQEHRKVAGPLSLLGVNHAEFIARQSLHPDTPSVIAIGKVPDDVFFATKSSFVFDTDNGQWMLDSLHLLAQGELLEVINQANAYLRVFGSDIDLF